MVGTQQRVGRGRAAGMAIGALVLCSGTSRALADAVWIKPTGGNWSSSTSWQGGQFPTSSQVVYLDERAGGTALTFTANMNGSLFNSQCKALFVQTNTVTIDLGPGSENLTLQGNFPTSASLVVGQKNISGTDYAGTLKIVNTTAFDSDRLTGSDAMIGTGPGPVASFIVRGGGRADLGPMTIGGSGAGTVSVENGGDLNGGTVTVGTSAAGTGALTVTDSGSTGDFGQINLGSGGTGTVSVASGGVFTTSTLVVGLNAAGSGLLTVGGGGSTATTTSTTIGNGGTGTVTVNAAGSFTAGTLNIGQNAVGSGQFNIIGSGATANTTGTATVGNGGTGTVSVSATGALTANVLTIGASAVGSGLVTLSGAGTTAGVTTATTVGNGGNGTLTINSAGVLTSATMVVGSGSAGTGQVNITGTNSRATMSSTAKVGNGSTGIVTVGAGGRLECTSLTVGASATGSGQVTASGAGTVLQCPSGVFVGTAGTGSILVQGGATMSGAGSIGLASPAGDGTVTVDGAGSAWTAGFTQVGYQGAGTIVLSNGGSFAATAPVYIGYSPLATADGLVEVGAGCTFSSLTMLIGSDTPAAPRTGRLVLKGGAVNMGTTTIRLNTSGVISGHGTITSTSLSPGVMVRGEISPSGDTPATYGTLTLNMSKVSMDDTVLQDLPTVRVRVRGDDAGPHDALVVSGELGLKGALIVESAGSLPGGGNTLSLPIITAGSFAPASSRFHAALLPALPDGRFYRVTYPEVGGSVTLNVQSLFNTPNFGDSANSSVNAVVTAADRGDLSGDGLDDLAVTTSDGFVFVLIGNGDGTFSQTVQLPVGIDPRGVAIADLDPANPNANGKDIVVSNAGSNTLTIYSRTGAGVWFVAATPAVGTAPMGLCALDIDGDGDADIAAANFGSNTVSLLLGSSNSTISMGAQTQFPTDTGPTDVDPWDPDNSKGGSQSLVTSNESAGTMSFLVNNGSGFNAPINKTSGEGPFQVITGDFNLDGSSDAATLNSDGTMTLFICDGAGSFLDGAPIPVGDSPRSFARADLDLDGDLDIAVVADNDSSTPVVKVFRNDTDPSDNNLTLASPSEVSTPTPQIVLTGLVDPDSRPDLITVGSGPRTLTTVTTVANSSLCPSDYDQNGFVNGDDFDAFVIEFYYGTILADFDHNGFVNGDDFDGFTAAFEAGC